MKVRKPVAVNFCGVKRFFEGDLKKSCSAYINGYCCAEEGNPKCNAIKYYKEKER